MIPEFIGEKGGISFYEHCDGNVFGCKDNRFSSVNCSKFTFPSNTSEVEKVKRLLVNNRAESIFDHVKGEIVFRQCSMVGWKELSKEEFSDEINFLFLSKKGELCFGVGNKFIIRGNNSEERVVEFTNGEVVKRACETSDGEFVILTIKEFKKSKIYYCEKSILEIDETDLELCVTGESLLCCTDYEFAAIDLQKGTFPAREDTDARPHIFSDGAIFWIKDNMLYQSIFSNGRFQAKQIKQYSVYAFKALDDERLLLKTSDEERREMDVQLFNRITGSTFSGRRPYQVVKGILAIESWGRESACAISDQLIVHQKSYVKESGVYTFYDFFKNSEWDAEITEGFHPVVSRLLSDKSVAYITDTASSKFHILSKKGEKYFSSIKLTHSLDGCHILELPNGNIVIGYLNYRSKYGVLQVLEPDFSFERFESEKKKVSELVEKLDFYSARRTYREMKREYPLSREIGEIFCDSTKELLKKGMLSIQTRRFAKNFLREIHLSERRLYARSRRYRKRLFVGEGSFHFSEILLNKHRKKHLDLAKSIVATELMFQEDFEGTEDEIEELNTRINDLEKRKLKVLFGVDATKIDERFKGERFQRIHWNSPFGPAKERKLFYPVLPKFFRSAAKLQNEGDRIHIALDQPKDYWQQRQNENPLVCAATLSKYRLVRKRRFDQRRYPGIYHQKTGKFEKYAWGETGREFIFEKSTDDLPSKEAFEKDLETVVGIYKRSSKTREDKKKDAVFSKRLMEEVDELEITEEKKFDLCFQELCKFSLSCSTDEGSSDYYSSESE